MAAKKLEKPEWSAFFDRLSKMLQDEQRAEIEVSSLSVGDQFEAEWLPLIGITYDRKDDVLEVALEGMDHMIRAPREIYVDFGVGGLLSVAVTDASGSKQIIKLREPLMLPSPKQQRAS
jgi:hypothetical protein